MKRIVLSIAILLGISNGYYTYGGTSSFYIVSEIQCKLRNDTNLDFVYSINGVTYTLEPGKSVGLSYPENTELFHTRSGSVRPVMLLKITASTQGKSLLVSELLH